MLLSSAARWEAFLHPDNEAAEAARRAGFARPGDLWKHIALDAAASRHLIRVLRLREGDEIALFDGTGGALAWPALMRKMDRLDPSFRD